MREIKIYEAFDGVMFKKLGECKEYEDNAKEKIINDFKSLIVRENEGLQITDTGCAFPLAEMAEDWWYAIIIMKNEDDYKKAAHYASYVNPCHESIPKIFNKEIIVATGEGNRERSYYNDFYFHGTIEDAVADYTMTLLTFNVKKGD